MKQRKIIYLASIHDSYLLMRVYSKIKLVSYNISKGGHT